MLIPDKELIYVFGDINEKMNYEEFVNAIGVSVSMTETTKTVNDYP
jgi:Ca2+-binding EF-hand superfamily protein